MSVRRQTYEKLRRQYDADCERHELRVGVSGPYVFAFTMRRPNEWTYGVEILCTPVGIVMHGDFTPPGNRGPCGAYLKTLPWFAAEMDAYYLAGKILEKGWTPEGSEDHVRDNIAGLRDGITYFNKTDSGAKRDEMLARCTRLEEMADCGDGFETHEEYEILWSPEWEEDDSDTEHVYPSHSYDPASVAALAAIHACFRRLFWKRYETIECLDDGFVLIERAAESGLGDRP